MYSTADLNKSGVITVNAETGGDFSYYSWQKQERFKGRFGIDFWAGNAGTSDIGWGFSSLGYWELGASPMYHPYYVENVLMMDHVRTERYTIEQAIAATNDAQLVVDPVFRHNLFLGIPSASLTVAERDVFLARGVPALSGPAGSRSIGGAHQEENLNALSDDPCWPRRMESRWCGWQHGDISAIALTYVFRAFQAIQSIISTQNE